MATGKRKRMIILKLRRWVQQHKFLAEARRRRAFSNSVAQYLWDQGLVISNHSDKE